MKLKTLMRELVSEFNKEKERFRLALEEAKAVAEAAIEDEEEAERRYRNFLAENESAITTLGTLLGDKDDRPKQTSGSHGLSKGGGGLTDAIASGTSETWTVAEKPE